ncbi:MAG: stage II sporulation protein P [Hominenteromicrobium sp.]
MRKIAVKAVWMRKTAWTLCVAASAALCVWCVSDNLLPVFRENGGSWALRTAGLAAASPAPSAAPEVYPEAESPLQTPEQEDGILSPWTEPKAAPTPDPSRETAPVVETQLLGGQEVDGFSVKDTSASGVDLLEELQIDPDVQVKRDGSPVVLLYSTHTSESFLLEDTDWYYTDDDFRSTDPEESVVAVAAEAAKVIEAGGFGVIHDTTMHDYPAYSGSYQRSMETIEKNLEAYPTIQITVDVHRDAFGEEEDGTRYKPVAEVNGKQAAQIMILTGCDLSEDPLFPDWRENLHLALRLQQKGEALYPGLFRPLFFAQRNYNMHASHGSILVEVGTEVNTLSEVKYSGKLLGETILAVLNDLAEE